MKINGDGTATITVLAKSAGDTFDVLDAETGAVIIANAGVGASGSKSVAGGRASYAVNGSLSTYSKLINKPDKIIAMDYYSGVVKAGSDKDKPDWRRAFDGTPRWARHNKRVNILFSDASVRTMHWSEIDFTNSLAIQQRYYDAP